MIKINWKWRIIPIVVVGIVYLSLTAFKKNTIIDKVTSKPTRKAFETSRVPATNEELKLKQVPTEAEVAYQVAAERVTAMKIPQPDRLKDFRTLQAKVFRTKEDEKKWKKLISDSNLILEISTYLKNLPKADQQEFKDSQNAVLDLLVEALRGGSTVAEQAIFDVIKDSQVEDESLAQNYRELLAGVKAELLYQGSSVKPQLASQFQNLLPGPVSQKIWKNVQQQQADNLALSQAELQERLTK